MNKHNSIQWHHMSELTKEGSMRYTSPEEQKQEAYERGVEDSKWWIVGAVIFGAVAGFFIGRST